MTRGHQGVAEQTFPNAKSCWLVSVLKWVQGSVIMGLDGV